MPTWGIILLTIAIGATLALGATLFRVGKVNQRSEQVLQEQLRRIDLQSLEIAALRQALTSHQAEQRWLRDTQSLLARFLINRFIWPHRSG